MGRWHGTLPDDCLRQFLYEVLYVVVTRVQELHIVSDTDPSHDLGLDENGGNAVSVLGADQEHESTTSHFRQLPKRGHPLQIDVGIGNAIEPFCFVDEVKQRLAVNPSV